MLTDGHVLERLHHLLLAEAESLFHRHLKPASANKPDDVLELFLGPDDNTADDTRLGKCQARDVGHLVLRRLGQEPDHRDHAAESDGLDGLLDRAGAAVLEDVVYTAAAGDLLGFRRPVGGGLVIDGVVDAVFGLDVLELLVAARRDDGLCAGRSGQDEPGDGNTTSACRVLVKGKTSICGLFRQQHTLEKDRLARLQSLVSVQRVPRSDTSADEGSPLSVRLRRPLRNFYRSLIRDANVLCEDAICWSTHGVVPVVDRTVERSRIKGNDDSVSSAEPQNHFADLVDLAHHVGARDKIFLDREGVFRGCDGDISVVQGNASDFDEELVSVDGRDVLCTGLKSIEPVAMCESEDGVGRHD
jgi:hypothetical protein